MLLSCENKQKHCEYLGTQTSLWSSVIFGNRLAQHNYPLCLELTEPLSVIFLPEGFVLCCISECSQTPAHQQRALSPNLGACCSLKAKGSFAIHFDKSRNKPFICNLKQVG